MSDRRYTIETVAEAFPEIYSSESEAIKVAESKKTKYNFLFIRVIGQDCHLMWTCYKNDIWYMV